MTNENWSGYDKVYPQLIETMTTAVSLEVYLLFLMLLSFSFTLSYLAIVGWHAFSFIVRQLKILFGQKCKKKKKSQWLKISISFPLKMSRCILMWQVNSLIFTIKMLSYVYIRYSDDNGKHSNFNVYRYYYHRLYITSLNIINTIIIIRFSYLLFCA